MTGTQGGGTGSAGSKFHQGLSETTALEGGTYQEVQVEDCRVGLFISSFDTTRTNEGTDSTSCDLSKHTESSGRAC